MKAFNYADCDIDLAIRIKKEVKQTANNPSAQTAFLSLLADTNIATENIVECLENPTEMEKKLNLIQKGDVSFADDILGLSQKGVNDSRYRAYLALDKNNIIQIRIGNHYETKKAVLDKSNNKAQFLFQIVLVTTPPKPKAKDSVDNSTRIGNVRVLTDKIMSSESTIDDLKNTLRSINDYLISPSKSYESITTESKTHKNMNKKVIKMNEGTLRKIVAESVSKILSEDWNKQSDETVSEAYKPLGANYSDEFISNVNNSFKRQVADLQKFMNAYSDAILISGVIDKEKYDILFNLLGEINS